MVIRNALRPRSAVLVGHGWALHLGDGRISGWHRHHALQLSSGMDAPVSLASRDGRRLRTAPGWIIAPSHPHRIVCDGPMVTLLIESDGAKADALMSLLGDSPVAPLSPAQSAWLSTEARHSADGGWRTAHAARFVERAMQELAPAPPSPRRRDRRIAAVLRQLARDPASSQTLSELAAGVQLSPTRLTHLFRAQVGLAIRPYRLWLRVQVAARLMAAGASATAAAVGAGFSDSAHFTRTCKRMFGLNPSALPTMQFEP